MKINVTKIKRAVGKSFSFNFSEGFEPIKVKGGKVFFDRPVEVEVQLTNTGRILLVKGYILTAVKMTCSRCLEDFSLELKVDFEENYIPSSEARKDQGEGWDDEEDVIILTGEELDLTDKVLENILLALPMKVLCNQHCKGMCPVCGVNLNEAKCNCEIRDIDPRMQALEKLLKSE